MSDIEVRSVAELLAIALTSERKAAERYAELAAHMLDEGYREVGELFARMAESERGHAKDVEKMAGALGLTDLPAAPDIAWQHPLVRDDRERATTPGIATPYLALAHAVNNEETAFRFYSYVAANAQDPEVRRFAETFAQEELSHAALFREQRRRAYHAQRARTAAGAAPVPARVESLADLLRGALRFEHRFRDIQTAAASLGIDLPEGTAGNEELIKDLTRELSGLAPEGGSRTVVDDRGDAQPMPASRRQALRALSEAAQQAFAFYDRATVSAPTEDIMLRAQELTATALKRIEALARLSDR